MPRCRNTESRASSIARRKPMSIDRFSIRGFARTDVVGTGILLRKRDRRSAADFCKSAPMRCMAASSGEFDESDRLEPRSPYSASKAGGDLLVLSYWTTYRFPVVITRGSKYLRPESVSGKFIPLFATNAIDGEPLPLYGDGKQCRDWLSVYDHAAGIQHVRAGRAGNRLQCRRGNERENITVAEQIVTALGTPRLADSVRSGPPGHDRRYSIGAAACGPGMVAAAIRRKVTADGRVVSDARAVVAKDQER